jgi:molybdenum cofactor cytidylyltransferase
MGELWAVILAAGESKRMGTPKMLLPFGGKTMIECVVRNVTGSDVDKTLIVLGAYSEIILEIVKELPVRSCYNDKYKEGMLSSVKCGFGNLPDEFDAVLVFQGDQPFITPKATNLVIEAYRLSGKGIVIPVYNKKRGHPLMINRKYKDEVENLDPNEGLRSLAQKYSYDVYEVETGEQGILRDFDTFEEYQKEINIMQ